jgi:pentatricopeptide repeat protein
VDENGEKEKDRNVVDENKREQDAFFQKSKKDIEDSRERDLLQEMPDGIGDADDPGDAFPGTELDSFLESKQKQAQVSTTEVSQDREALRDEASIGSAEGEEEDAFAGIDFDSLPSSRGKKDKKKKEKKNVRRRGQGWTEQPISMTETLANDMRDFDTGRTEAEGAGESPLAAEEPEMILKTPIEIDDQTTWPGEDVATMRDLRRIVSRKPGLRLAEDDVLPEGNALEAAMGVYNRLQPPAKPSPTVSLLTDALLNWLKEHKRTEADAHFISVWNSAPTTERSHKTFENALVVFRRQEQPLRPLHDAMFEAFPVKPQLHSEAFRLAFEDNDWDLAFHIHTEALALGPPADNEKLQGQLFHCLGGSLTDEDRNKILSVKEWVRNSGVSSVDAEMQNIQNENHQDLDGERKSFASSLCQFVATEVSIRLLSKGFYLKADDPQLDKKTSSYRGRRTAYYWQDQRIIAAKKFVTDLLDYIFSVSPAVVGTSFAERTMASLLSLSEKRDDPEVYEILAKFYLSYRKSPTAHPPESLLYPLLGRSIRWEKSSARSEDNHLPLAIVIDDWLRFHTKFSREAFKVIIRHYAEMEKPDLVNEYFNAFMREYPHISSWGPSMWLLVQPYVRSGNVTRAEEAFQRLVHLAQPFNSTPNRFCWTALIHTYARADDITKAFKALQLMHQASEEDPKLAPTAHVFHVICNMLARRGDVDNVRALLKQHDELTGMKRTTHLIGSEILALLENYRIEEAKEILYASVADGLKGEVKGSHTQNFNLVIMSLGQARDLSGAVSVYKEMKKSGVALSDHTYAALIYALCGTNNEGLAFGMLRYLMPREGFMPTSISWSIVMKAYLIRERFREVVWMHTHLQRTNVRSDKTIEQIYLEARTQLELKAAGLSAPKTWKGNGPAVPFERSRPVAEEMFRLSDSEARTIWPPKEPSDGVDESSDRPASGEEIETEDSPEPVSEHPENTQPISADEPSAEVHSATGEHSLADAQSDSADDAVAKTQLNDAAEVPANVRSDTADKSDGDVPDRTKQEAEDSHSQANSVVEESTEAKPPGGEVFGPFTLEQWEQLVEQVTESRRQIRLAEVQEAEEFVVDSVQDTADLLPFADGYSFSKNRHDVRAEALLARQHFDHILKVYGAERSLEAARQLFARYVAQGVDPPNEILAYLMRALNRLRQHKEVESCWELAKEQADRMVAPVTLPVLRPFASRRGEANRTTSSAESTLHSSQPHQKPGKSGSVAQTIQGGRRLMLSRPALFYMKTLVDSGRIADAINLVTSLISEGYSLDTMTWNVFIRYLCSGTPPYTLLAFQLTERFLIPNFPGWLDEYWPVPDDHELRTGLQHIRARYIRVDHLMPQYQTFICLSRALLTLRRAESVGTQYLEAPHLMVKGVNLARYVGRLRQIRQNAPRTLYAVQCMPKLNDEWQRQLRREDDDFGDEDGYIRPNPGPYAF